MSNRHREGLGLRPWPGTFTAIVLGMALVLQARPAQAVSLDFWQGDLVADGTATPDSDWGAVDLTFSGASGLQYLNLNVNGTWQLQNVPFASVEGAGVPHRIRFFFDLGVTPGTDVSSLSYGYAVTSAVLPGMPSLAAVAPVGDMQFVRWAGIEGGQVACGPASGQVGGQVLRWAKQRPGFPNQECDEGECVPAAVSNSLKFLNAAHQLGIDPGKLTTEKMKDAVKWKAQTFAPRNWLYHKNEWAKNNNVPVRGWYSQDIEPVFEALRKGWDVEILAGRSKGQPAHVAAVTAIFDLGGGRYKLEVRHDLWQGTSGGTLPTEIEYDAGKKKFTGGLFFKDRFFEGVVIESVIPEPVTGWAAAAALVSLGGYLRRRRGAGAR